MNTHNIDESQKQYEKFKKLATKKMNIKFQKRQNYSNRKQIISYHGPRYGAMTLINVEHG